MTLTQARIAMRRAGRAAPFSRVYKSSIGLGFLTLVSYEVVVPALGHVPNTAMGTLVGAAGMIAGLIIALRG